ncbi:hypothetical protein FB451DRAFT_41753 [Mycena latifolia]|nr:hypothetical protein FB451DRAFT_41753 [Mycena latifolia]
MYELSLLLLISLPERGRTLLLFEAVRICIQDAGFESSWLSPNYGTADSLLSYLLRVALNADKNLHANSLCNRLAFLLHTSSTPKFCGTIDYAAGVRINHPGRTRQQVIGWQFVSEVRFSMRHSENSTRMVHICPVSVYSPTPGSPRAAAMRCG